MSASAASSGPSDKTRDAVTPAWDDIGRIAAIAVVRTFLNFF
ncbi:DUF1622 domain-containing protein [Phyllobacterium bourgognense]